MAFDRKNNHEIAVAVRSDQFITYVQNAVALHRYGRQPETYALLTKASSLQTIPDAEIASLTQERRRIVREVSQLSRMANFRQQVKNAYGNRCAVTRMQLRLVDGAHILPVGAPESVDDVRNGLALSPTYHRAYDTGLIYLDEAYQMRVNPAKLSTLASLRLTGGLEAFKAPLGKIHLPQDKRQWSHLTFIRKANQFRRIGAG